MKTKWVICFTCSGDGHVVNPDIDACGLTDSDWHDDPDFKEDYMSGVYDIQCRTCSGTGKLLRTEARSKRDMLQRHAEERRLAAREDGDWEAYQHAGDYRYG
jgi:hypothetical protein